MRWWFGRIEQRVGVPELVNVLDAVDVVFEQVSGLSVDFERIGLVQPVEIEQLTHNSSVLQTHTNVERVHPFRSSFLIPTMVLYYLYFSSSGVASSAADDARARAFEVTVKEPLPQYPGQWSLTCERRDVVLDTDTIRGNSDYFDDLAARFGGEYDGWEASVR